MRLMSLALLLLSITLPLQAAERNGTLSIELEARGKQNWTAGSDYGKASIHERYRITVALRAEADPMDFNPLAADYAKQQMAKAASAQRAVAKAQNRPVIATKTEAEYQAQMQALAQRMQKEQLACGQNTQCMMQLATRFAQDSAAILPPGAEGAAAVADGHEETPRYLMFLGAPNCKATIEVLHDSRADGAYADVAGMTRTSFVEKGNGKTSDAMRSLLCVGQQLVYDLQTRRIDVQAVGLPPARGFSEYRENGSVRISNNDSELGGFKGLGDWATKQLKQAEASGTRRATLPVPQTSIIGPATAGAKFDGAIEVTMRWSFKPE